jgi:hypothetical protein
MTKVTDFISHRTDKLRQTNIPWQFSDMKSGGVTHIPVVQPLKLIPSEVATRTMNLSLIAGSNVGTLDRFCLLLEKNFC